MADKANIQEKMEVVGSDGEHVGTVDHFDGSRVKLTRKDPAAGGKHHYIPLDWVADVGTQVRLSKTATDARKEWQAEA
ncbi:MAG: DUF2171 domain-containing protein [Gemmatimonadaceae bacterium]